jgi:hypothetical protein
MPPVRDKRYTIPVLWVDLFESAMNVIAWKMEGLFISGYEGKLVEGMNFTGVFTFPTVAGRFGLFEAKVRSRSVEAKGLIAEFVWLSPGGKELLEKMDSAWDEKNKKHLHVPVVSRIRRTINWSFSGMLLEYNEGEHQTGQRCNAMLRVEKSNTQAIAQISVIRVNAERQTMATRFTSLSDDSFALLEDAIKKQGRE